ncbi:MAG TPA: trypsin-like peptidase domain-containing protein [Kofleriaceae bacterium]|nr:trypsin-like peptidase domain-containing protein [Kofleriaceae bacterium]
MAVILLFACREHEGPPDARAAAATIGIAAPAAAPSRIMYGSSPGSFVDLVANARHGVVAIRAAQPVRSGPAAMFPGAPESAADVALGTGFLIEAKGVYVVTNDHVAAAAPELHVVLPDGREVPAKLVGRDVRLDLALLSVDVPRLVPLPIGDSDELEVGEWVVVLGDAFGDEVTASAGIVSSTGREAVGSLVPGRAMGFRTFIQTDARIHRGNSGGPMLNTAGQVVGVAVATGDRPGELSFAIPIARVREIVDALRDYGQVARSWLGAFVKPVTTELATSLGLPKTTGALVTEVKAGSPAARAGVRPGDVILKWGDRDVDHRTLPWLVASTPPGKATTVTVWRSGAEVPIAVMPEKMPE